MGVLQSDRPCSIIMKVRKSVAELVLLLKWMRSTEAVSAGGLVDNDSLYPVACCAPETSPAASSILPPERGGCRVRKCADSGFNLLAEKPSLTTGFQLLRIGSCAENLSMCELARVAHSSGHREY